MLVFYISDGEKGNKFFVIKNGILRYSNFIEKRIGDYGKNRFTSSGEAKN